MAGPDPYASGGVVFVLVVVGVLVDDGVAPVVEVEVDALALDALERGRPTSSTMVSPLTADTSTQLPPRCPPSQAAMPRHLGPSGGKQRWTPRAGGPGGVQ